MNITPIDLSNRLFQITDAFPEDLAKEVLSIDWPTMPWNRGYLQEAWSRRQIHSDQQPVLQQVAEYIWQNLEAIESVCNVTFNNRYSSTVWWYDEPGFDVNLHTDGHLPATMQIFWVAPGKQYATQFYKSKNANDPITQLEFVPNTGYLMLNMLNEDGSQPLNWHGMLNKVPADTFRVTSYTTFGTYENK